MLERTELLLQPAGAGWAVNAADGTPLGSARWLPPTGPCWHRWLGRWVLEVREDDDEPLLCTLRRHWALPPGHEVRDADDGRLGFVTGPWLRDAAGQRFAVRRPECEAPGWRFLTAAGSLLAEARAADSGVWLRFAPAAAGQPFVKMLLLAATLLTL